MPPKKIPENPISENQVTVAWLKEKLKGQKGLPKTKSELWDFFEKSKTTAKTKKLPSKINIASLKVADLRSLAESKGLTTKGLLKSELIEILGGKPKAKPKPARKVGVRTIIPNTGSLPPQALTKNCESLVADHKLMNHQKRIVEHFQKHDGLIAFHRTGSGKTLTACAAAMCFLKDQKDKNVKAMVFVAVPAPLVDNFIEEGLKKFYGLSHNAIARNFVVDTYTKLVKYIEKENLAKHPFMLIVDEVHNLKTQVGTYKKGTKKGQVKGGRAASILELATNPNCKKSLVLSGTIFRNTVKDLKNLAAIAKHKIDTKFLESIGNFSKGKPRSYSYSQTKIRKYFKCLISYYPASPKDFPEEVEHNLEVAMPKDYWKEYLKNHEEAKGYLKSYSEGDKKPMYVIKMRTSANKLVKQGKSFSPKADAIVQIVKKDPSLKTIIYSFYIESGVQAVEERLKKEGLEYTYLDSKLPQAEKSKIVKSYNEDKISILIITKATSEGLDLKGTRRIFIMEKDYNSATNKQIVARGVRYKSHEHLPPKERRVDVYYMSLVLPKGTPRPGPDPKTGAPFLTIDERIDQIVKEKDQQEAELMAYLIGKKAKVTIEFDPACK
jgi:hypothetical protein